MTDRAAPRDPRTRMGHMTHSICLERGYHDDEEFIDPKSGGFVRCKDCKRDLDCEESEAW